MLNRVAGVISLFLMLPGLALAADAPALNSGNTAWILTATALVLFMTLPGLALFYGGLVRSKNVLSVLMQTLAVFSLVAVLWALYGYSFAFTEGNAFIGGFDRLWAQGINGAAAATLGCASSRSSSWRPNSNRDALVRSSPPRIVKRPLATPAGSKPRGAACMLSALRTKSPRQPSRAVVVAISATNSRMSATK